MIKKIDNGVYLLNGEVIAECDERTAHLDKKECMKKTIAYNILHAHTINEKGGKLNILFDSMASHDITYVGIVQTARVSGLKEFPIPYVLTNCHNSLCAVGGTINEDDHKFGLSAAVKYGGIFVPPHVAVIHQYMREMMAKSGNMIIGSDSHTRYGALGTMAFGEGGPELVKQLMRKPYEIKEPDVVCIYMTGKPRSGVGPQDVALAIIKEVFKDGFVKNKVMEFCGPGVYGLSADYRNGIDVMTTETTCLSSIWCTDDVIKEYYTVHGREEDYKKLEPDNGAYYSSCVQVELGSIKPMIAMPFHPGNSYTIEEFLENADDILNETENNGRKQYGSKVSEYRLREKFYEGKMHVDQGIVAGCSGGSFENIMNVSNVLKNESIGCGAFTMSVYPASEPVYTSLLKNGAVYDIVRAGAVMRSAFCGPCFGAGDVPSNNGFSIRHTTRNFPNREGSKPSDGQISWVALMDARSIAATAFNKGILTPATAIEGMFEEYSMPKYEFDKSIYENRLYSGFGKAKLASELSIGPNIKEWPEIAPLNENILLVTACVINDAVTTTDELIPSGETSSYRSNPLRLSEFTLSRKDPAYVSKAKKIKCMEDSRIKYLSGDKDESGFLDAFKYIEPLYQNTGIGSVVVAVKPGDGSAREQAASSQRVLGGAANIAKTYATKRYRSNLINWGMLPFTCDSFESLNLHDFDRIYIKGIRSCIENRKEDIDAVIYRCDGTKDNIVLHITDLSDEDIKILLYGNLMNYLKGEYAK